MLLHACRTKATTAETEPAPAETATIPTLGTDETETKADAEKFNRDLFPLLFGA